MTRMIFVALALMCTGCAAKTHSPPPTSQANHGRGRDPAVPATAQSAPKISEFQGQYRFLSNFYPATVVFEGITYPTAEHAYQSAKTTKMSERRRIAQLATPADAKREGRALSPQRPDWEQVKFNV